MNDGLPPELVRVRNSIASELSAQLGLRDETISLADVCEVAYAVAFRLGMEFRIEPAAPLAHELPDDDTLGPDGAAFHGSIMPRDNEQGPSDRYPVFDHGWPSRPSFPWQPSPELSPWGQQARVASLGSLAGKNILGDDWDSPDQRP